MVDAAALRVIDANLNRSREGLRVCEEIARMVLRDPALTRRFQRIRYDLVAPARAFQPAKLLAHRDSRGDVGRPKLRGRPARHPSYRDLAVANAQRVQEALRVLEEFTRLNSSFASRAFGTLRFRVYSLEQELVSKLSPVRHR